MKLAVPQTTAPLTKFIRTLEGLLVTGCNAAILVAGAITQTLSPAQAVKYAVILNGVTVVARSLLKAVASVGAAPAAPAAKPPAK